MAKRIAVVISQGQSANPAKRGLEEYLVEALLFEPGLDVTVIPHLYDLPPTGTGMLCLSGIAGDMIVLSWLYPRAAHWVLARNGVVGQEGRTLLKAADEDEEEDEELEAEMEAAKSEKPTVAASKAMPNRRIYC